MLEEAEDYLGEDQRPWQMRRLSRLSRQEDQKMKLTKSRENLFQSSQEDHLSRSRQSQGDQRTFFEKIILSGGGKPTDGA